MNLSGDINWGLGGSVRFSFRLVKSGWDFDVNVAYRRKPSRFIDGEVLNQIIPFITLSKNKSFVYS